VRTDVYIDATILVSSSMDASDFLVFSLSVDFSINYFGKLHFFPWPRVYSLDSRLAKVFSGSSSLR
jgi:hypothetical protein